MPLVVKFCIRNTSGQKLNISALFVDWKQMRDKVNVPPVDNTSFVLCGINDGHISPKMSAFLKEKMTVFFFSSLHRAFLILRSSHTNKFTIY